MIIAAFIGYTMACVALGGAIESYVELKRRIKRGELRDDW